MTTRKRASRTENAQFKVIMVGRSAAGKSSLLARYTKDVFIDDYQVTVGVQFATKVIKIDENVNVKLQIWDTAGQQSFKSIIKSYYRNSSVVFLVFDITSKESFSSLEIWLAEAKENSPANVMFVMIGTHLDEADKRQVPKEEADTWMKNNNISVFFQTSSKTAENVARAFEQVANQLFMSSLGRAKSSMSNRHTDPSINHRDNRIELDVRDVEPTSKESCCN